MRIFLRGKWPPTYRSRPPPQAINQAQAEIPLTLEAAPTPSIPLFLGLLSSRVSATATMHVALPPSGRMGQLPAGYRIKPSPQNLRKRLPAPKQGSTRSKPRQCPPKTKAVQSVMHSGQRQHTLVVIPHERRCGVIHTAEP